MTKLIFRLKGGPGSGFHGHAGIPGHQGGSQAEDGGMTEAVEPIKKIPGPKKMTAPAVMEWLQEGDVYPSYIHKIDSNKFKVEFEYFYHHGNSAESVANTMEKKLGKSITITNTADTYRPFKGGKKGSTFDVEFEINQN
jgi:hypothetical protein